MERRQFLDVNNTDRTGSPLHRRAHKVRTTRLRPASRVRIARIPSQGGGVLTQGYSKHHAHIRQRVLDNHSKCVSGFKRPSSLSPHHRPPPVVPRRMKRG